jgi:hypothetical protein
VAELELALHAKIPLGTQLQRKLNQVKYLDIRMGKLQARIKTKEEQRDEILSDLSEFCVKNSELQEKIDSAKAESQSLTLAYQLEGKNQREGKLTGDDDAQSNPDESMEEGHDTFEARFEAANFENELQHMLTDYKALKATLDAAVLPSSNKSETSWPPKWVLQELALERASQGLVAQGAKRAWKGMRHPFQWMILTKGGQGPHQGHQGPGGNRARTKNQAQRNPPVVVWNQKQMRQKQIDEMAAGTAAAKAAAAAAKSAEGKGQSTQDGLQTKYGFVIRDALPQLPVGFGGP